MQPPGGQYIALQALQFLAVHLLSSLVRYRPATWMHALSRSANNGRAADPLIEPRESPLHRLDLIAAEYLDDCVGRAKPARIAGHDPRELPRDSMRREQFVTRDILDVEKLVFCSTLRHGN